MNVAKKAFFQKKGTQLVKNLQSRHFEAYYCDTKEDALQKALDLIPEGSSIGWGGTVTAEEIGLIDAVKAGSYKVYDRATATTAEDRDTIQRQAMFADYFLTSANGLSLDGQMVNIDGFGNRVSAIICCARNVLVIVGMHKVTDSLEEAVKRARTVAAPMNKQRFGVTDTPCCATGYCHDCKSEGCICNHIVITRHSRPTGRIKFILVGEEVGF